MQVGLGQHWQKRFSHSRSIMHLESLAEADETLDKQLPRFTPVTVCTLLIVQIGQ
jgi:hypothetical protein